MPDRPHIAASARALQALVELRPVLRRLENELVVRARLEGLQWSEIAELLDMSRQSAMRRHTQATWHRIRAG